jgi:hypothetical protein
MTDEPTIVPPKSLALVIDKEGKLEILLPRLDDEEVLPSIWLAVMKEALELQKDPERCAAIADAWMEEADESRTVN